MYTDYVGGSRVVNETYRERERTEPAVSPGFIKIRD